MKRLLFLAILAICWSVIWATPSLAQEPILIGVPTSVTFIEGKECLKAVELAVAEINAKGGVKVGDTKRPIKIESLDLRDASPGVPVSEALLGLEKIITEKKVQVIMVGPFRSEALIPGMDILNKYKVPMLGTIAMSPKSEAMVKENPEKYKYCFRVCLNAIYLGKYLSTTLGFLKKEFGFNKVVCDAPGRALGKGYRRWHYQSSHYQDGLGERGHRGVSYRRVGLCGRAHEGKNSGGPGDFADI